MILILGATSTIGRASIPLLLETGQQLRLASRTPERLAEFAGENVEVVQADLLDEASIRQACKGVDTVFASVASLLGKGKNASHHVDLDGHKMLIDIAVEYGVGHFVYMSTQEAVHDSPAAFFRHKAVTEDYLRASGLSYTILRASAFFVPHVELIGESVLKGGPAMIMGQGENPRNFIANEDVARYAVLALTTDTMKNQTIDIGGPENLTARQVAEIYASVAGVDLKTRVIPRFVPKIMGRLMRPFYVGLSDVMAAIVDSDTYPKSFDVGPVVESYPVQLTRLEDWVQQQVR
jgi:uncharacterized protein YbjT (DUF2867 family)